MSEYTRALEQLPSLSSRPIDKPQVHCHPILVHTTNFRGRICLKACWEVTTRHPSYVRFRAYPTSWVCSVQLVCWSFNPTFILFFGCWSNFCLPFFVLQVPLVCLHPDTVLVSRSIYFSAWQSKTALPNKNPTQKSCLALFNNQK